MAIIFKKSYALLVASAFLLLYSTGRLKLAVPEGCLSQVYGKGDGMGGSPMQRIMSNSPNIRHHRTRWTDAGSIPQTALTRHVAGWSVFENLYAHNGTFYIINDDPSSFPIMREMISSPNTMQSTTHNISLRDPTDSDMQMISSNEAIRRFGYSANRVNGVSYTTRENVSKIALEGEPNPNIVIPRLCSVTRHYYHLIGEVLMGLWRTYSSLDTKISQKGETWLSAPSRIMFPLLDTDDWRDRAHINHVILRAAFPSISVEVASDWQDRASTSQLYAFQMVALAARTAGHRGKKMWLDKPSSSTRALPSSPYWWEPIRSNVLEYAGLEKGRNGLFERPPKPVITYIVRQGRSRALKEEDHLKLVEALQELEKKHGWEVNIAMMERYSKAEQLRLAGRTTVLLGVHGNGLTNLLWMLPSPSATVIEIFIPEGFTNDYALPADMAGIEHYGVWYDNYFRTQGEFAPKRPFYPKGFHGNEIPVHGPTVARLIEERILKPNKLSSKMASSAASSPRT